MACSVEIEKSEAHQKDQESCLRTMNTNWNFHHNMASCCLKPEAWSRHDRWTWLTLLSFWAKRSGASITIIKHERVSFRLVDASEPKARYSTLSCKKKKKKKRQSMAWNYVFWLWSTSDTLNGARIFWVAHNVLVGRTPNPQPYTSLERIALLFPQHLAHLFSCQIVGLLQRESPSPKTHIYFWNTHFKLLF